MDVVPLFFRLSIKMTSEIQVLFEYYEKEKEYSKTMVEALSTALLSAARKSVGPARELRVDVNPDKGDIVAVAKLIASENVNFHIGNFYEIL